MRLRFVPLAPAYPRRCALMYGPVLLALTGTTGGPLVGPLSAPEAWIEQAGGGPLRFALKDDPGRGVFVPFYEIPERMPYFVYLDIVEEG